LLDITKIVVTILLVMKDVVAFSRALADPTRWRIVSLVMDEALCVCELADILEMPQSTLSSHVQVIRRAGLLESEKCEKWTYFRIERGVLPLVREIARQFDSASDRVLKADARKAVRRLACREASCCPGPRKLISPPKRKTQAS
jgi:ArsR family transcriptional regulator